MPALQLAADSLWRSLKTAAGVSVTYSQGATTVTAIAVPGNTAMEMQNTEGMVTTERIQDFIFAVADMLGVTPKRNDKITWGTRLFLVVHPAGGRQYDYADPYHTLYRVHTKEINIGS